MKIVLIVLAAILALVLLTYTVVDVIMPLFYKGDRKNDYYFKDSDDFSSAPITSLVKQTGKDYKMLVISDLQLGTLNNTGEAVKMMEELITQSKPDLVVFTGDLTERQFNYAELDRLINTMTKLNIPYASVLGNHDGEGVADRYYTADKLASAPNSLFKKGPTNIHGLGNYVLNLNDQSGNTLYSLFMMDSNQYRDYDGKTDYDFIYYDQIKWYEWNVKNIDKKAGKSVPSMVFIHIPLPEYADAYKAWEASGFDQSIGSGKRGEKECCPPVNTGFFDKMQELGSTKFVFCGHDHVNNYSVLYKGIRLSYCQKTGYTSYFDKSTVGATLITVNDKADVKIDYIYK